MRLQFHEIYLPRTFIIAQMFECFKTYFIKLSICKKIRIRFQKNILPHCVILVSTLMERFIRRKYLSFCGSKDRRGKAKTRQQAASLALDRKRKETVSRKKRQTKVYRCHSADSYYEQSIQIVYSINNVQICTIFLLGFTIQLNEYETAPYFLQLSQNMTSNCLFTFVFSRSYLNLPILCQKLFCFDVQNNFRC